MTLFRGLAVLALAVAMAPAVYAQDPTPTPQTTQTAQTTQGTTFSAMPEEPEGFTVTPFVGVGFAGDFENSPTAFGFAAGYGISERVSVEGDLYFAPDGEQGEIIEFNTSIWSVSGNVLYNFAGQTGFTPYVVGGLGMLSANADAEDLGLTEDDTSTEFAWNWGGGVKSALSDRFGLRADLRFFNGDELAPDHWRLVGGVTIRNIGR
jgi:opacity protein-like surface antigen